MVVQPKKKMREHTILFTEKCPLACTYCNLKTDTVFGTNDDLTEDEVEQMLADFAAMDDPEIYETRIVWTGGEPFLFWPMIKRRMEKWGTRFSYLFNTSGYLLTREILEFLSQYQVDFNLSVDGPSCVTDKLRPTVNPLAEPYYSKVSRDVFPELLYYYPMVTWKTIITKEYIGEVFNTYLECEAQGFRRIHFILDFLSTEWDEKEITQLQNEFYKIVAHMIVRFEQGQDILQIRDFGNFIYTMLETANPSPDALICKVFDGRTLRTLNAPHDGWCLSKLGTFSEVREMLEKRLKELNGRCPRDEECGYFKFCANFCCPKNSYDDSGDFYRPRDIECILNRIVGNACIALLQYGNTHLQENWVWHRYIDKCRRRDY